MQSYEKSRAEQNEFTHFLCRDGVSWPILLAELRKKLVKNNGFWKINAFRPEIKARRRRTRKYENEDIAKQRGLVKELGFQIVTLKSSRTQLILLPCLVLFLKFAGKGTSKLPDRLFLKIPCCEITLQENKTLMSAELAHQKADKHLCVALHRKVRIRLHPSTALQTEIFAEYCHFKRKGHSFS